MGLSAKHGGQRAHLPPRRMAMGDVARIRRRTAMLSRNKSSEATMSRCPRCRGGVFSRPSRPGGNRRAGPAVVDRANTAAPRRAKFRVVAVLLDAFRHEPPPWIQKGPAASSVMTEGEDVQRRQSRGVCVQWSRKEGEDVRVRLSMFWGALLPHQRAGRTPVQAFGFCGGMNRLAPDVSAP